MELVTSGSPSLDTLNVLTVVQCIFFFFQCYHIHVDLHSFPTRRSSDLSGVNPVPAFGFFSLFAQGFGAAPIRALADVPSIQFNNEHKRLLGRGGLGSQMNYAVDGGRPMLSRLLQSQSTLCLARGRARESG